MRFRNLCLDLRHDVVRGNASNRESGGNPEQSRYCEFPPSPAIIMPLPGLPGGKAMERGGDESGDLPHRVYFNNLVDWIMK